MASVDGPNGAHIDEFVGYTNVRLDGTQNPRGGLFNIRGEHFGTVPQPVTINGKEMRVTGWRDTVIRGLIPYPAGARSRAGGADQAPALDISFSIWNGQLESHRLQK
jgi:hypothetical protein